MFELIIDNGQWTVDSDCPSAWDNKVVRGYIVGQGYFVGRGLAPAEGDRLSVGTGVLDGPIRKAC